MSTSFERRPASDIADIAYRGQQAQENLKMLVCRLLQPTMIMTPSKLGVRGPLTPPSSSDSLPVEGEHLHRILLQRNTTGNSSLLLVSTICVLEARGTERLCHYPGRCTEAN